MKEIIKESGESRITQVLLGLVPSVSTVAILTSENPNAVQQSKEDNKASNDSLKKYLKDGLFGYWEIKGKYGVKENSFIINNPSEDAAVSLASMYHQKSYIYGVRDDLKELVGDNKFMEIFKKYNFISRDGKLLKDKHIMVYKMYANNGKGKYVYDNDAGTVVYAYDEHHNATMTFDKYNTSNLTDKKPIQFNQHQQIELTPDEMKQLDTIPNKNNREIAKNKLLQKKKSQHIKDLFDSDSDNFSAYKGKVFKIPFYDKSHSITESVETTKIINPSYHDGYFAFDIKPFYGITEKIDECLNRFQDYCRIDRYNRTGYYLWQNRGGIKVVTETINELLQKEIDENRLTFKD